jgi:putative ABC transport system permease protein
VTPGYFAALRIPLQRGREFTDTEAFTTSKGDCGPVGSALARRLFGDQDPLGREVRLPKNAVNRGLVCAIVGVVADVRWNGPANEPEPTLYRPLARDPLAATSVTILARSAQPTAQVAAALRRAASSLGAAVPLSVERRLTEVIDNRLADRRLTS